jgi:hypothetical protein
MHAPVYRHLDLRGALFGISVLEWAPLLVTVWVGNRIDRPNYGVLVAVALYAGLRLAALGRAEGFVRDFITWRRRQTSCGGRLSAIERARVPEFPFAEYECPELEMLEAAEPVSLPAGGGRP